MLEIQKKNIKTKDGLNIYYEKYILDKKAPTIFFVHGSGGDLEAWQYIKDEMLQKGFGSIAMDLRGHGYSSHPRAFKKYEIKNLAEDIEIILKKENLDKIFLVGHSFGSVVVMDFALRFPEKLKGLVVLSGTYKPPGYVSNKFFKFLFVKMINVLSFLSLPPINPGHSVYPVGKFHKDYEFYGLVKTVLRNSWGSYLLASKELFTVDLESKINKILTPTLIMVGDKDSIFPVEISKNIHNKIKNSRIEIIEGANHPIVLNNIKTVVNALNNFFQEIER